MKIARRPMLVASVLAVAWMFAAPASAQQPTAMRIGTVTPEAHPSSQVLKQVVERINARNVNVRAEAFPGASLGGDMELIDQVARGAIESSVAGGTGVLASFDPKFAIEELPFMFPSREAAYKALDGELGRVLGQLAEKQGFRIITFWENGFRHFTNSKRPIRTPSDMSGLRFRSAEIAIRLDMFRQLKASAVPMPFPELFQALQQGVVDGQENPIALIHAAGFANVQKHLSLSGHIYNAMPVVVSKTWWDKLDDAAKNAITEEFVRGRDEQRALLAKLENDLLEELKGKGMAVTEVDRNAFQAATESVWKTHESRFGPELMNLAREARSAP